MGKPNICEDERWNVSYEKPAKESREPKTDKSDIFLVTSAIKATLHRSHFVSAHKPGLQKAEKPPTSHGPDGLLGPRPAQLCNLKWSVSPTSHGISCPSVAGTSQPPCCLSSRYLLNPSAMSKAVQAKFTDNPQIQVPITAPQGDLPHHLQSIPASASL